MGGGRVAQALSVAADHGAGAFGGVVHGGQLGAQIAGEDDRMTVLALVQRPDDVVGRSAPTGDQVGQSSPVQRLVDAGQQDSVAILGQ